MAILIVASSVFLFFPHKEAQAIVPVHCPIPCETWDVALSGPLFTAMPGWFLLKEVGPGGVPGLSVLSWDSIAWEIARFFLREFTTSIIDWIKTGQDPFFSGGTEGTLFVTNIDQFLLDAADNAAGVFMAEHFGDAWDNLCVPFRLQVGIGLGHSYGRDYGSLKFQARCTLTDIVANVEDFYTSFANGGWEAFLASSFYENNPLGLLTLEENISLSRETRAHSANLFDFLAGLGFPGLRECPPENQIPGPTQGGEPLCLNNGYITKTPGEAIHEQLEDALGEEIAKLVEADELDEIIAQLLQGLLAWLIGGGSGGDGLLGSNLSTGRPPLCSQPSGRPSGCACTTTSQCGSGLTCSGGVCLVGGGGDGGDGGVPPPPGPPPDPPPPPGGGVGVGVADGDGEGL